MSQTANIARKSKEALSQAEDLAEDLRDDTVTRVNAAVKATRKAGSALAHDLVERASDTAEFARDIALDRAEAARAAVGDAGVRIADGFRAAADAVPEGLPARSFAAVGAGLEVVANSIGNSNLAVLAGRTRDFARRNPATFVIGSAVVGYALIRLLRSSSEVPARVEEVKATVAKPVRAAATKTSRAVKPAVKAATKTAAKTVRNAKA